MRVLNPTECRLAAKCFASSSLIFSPDQTMARPCYRRVMMSGLHRRAARGWAIGQSRLQRQGGGVARRSINKLFSCTATSSKWHTEDSGCTAIFSLENLPEISRNDERHYQLRIAIQDELRFPFEPCSSPCKRKTPLFVWKGERAFKSQSK